MSVSDTCHTKLKQIASARNVSIGQLIDEAIEDAYRQQMQSIIDRVIRERIDHKHMGRVY